MQDQNTLHPVHLASIQIRPVLLSDAARLHSKFWMEKDESTTHGMIQRALYNQKCNRGIALIAVEAETLALVGFGQLAPWKHNVEISDLIVDQNWRRRKIGTILIQHLLCYAQTFQFSIVEIGASIDHTAAITLYKQLGFKEFKTLTLQDQASIIYLRRTLERHD